MCCTWCVSSVSSRIQKGHDVAYHSAHRNITSPVITKCYQGTKWGHSGCPRQSISPPDNPISFSGFSSDKWSKIDKICALFLSACQWCRLSRHNLYILKHYNRGCRAVLKAISSQRRSDKFIKTKITYKPKHWKLAPDSARMHHFKTLFKKNFRGHAPVPPRNRHFWRALSGHHSFTTLTAHFSKISPHLFFLFAVSP